MSARYVVTCEDGQVRHSEPFTSRSDAAKFAEWGHCCTADHSIEYQGDDHGPGCDGPYNCVCSS